MLEFQIKTQIYHQCSTKFTFDWISDFFIYIRVYKENHKISHSNFIMYDQEFQFITYNLQRNLHMSLEELFIYSDQKKFKKLINQSLQILKDQNIAFQEGEFHKHLSIQNLDSSKIWLEFEKKKIVDVYILNFEPFVNDGKQITDIINYFNYLIAIKPDVEINQKRTKAQKNQVKKINQDMESLQLERYPIKTLEINNLNKAVNSFYLGISEEYKKLELSDYFQFIVSQSNKQITKIIECLKPIQNQPNPQRLLNQLQDIIKNQDSNEEKLELIIIKVIQKYNLFDEFFSKKYSDKTQIYKFIKQYLRVQIYNCILKENQEIIPYNKIIIYLMILNLKKSTADLETIIKQIFTYTHERLAIYQHGWSGKIISDQEILQYFLAAQTSILQSQKSKIINSNMFIEFIMQQQKYKERVLYLKKGLDTLKQHFDVEYAILAKDYFHLYSYYLMKHENNLINLDEIVSTIFLELVNLQLKTIINTAPQQNNQLK